MAKKWLVVYASVTGNTKYIAEAIYEKFGSEVADIRSIKEDFNVEDYEIIVAGYWLTKGGPSPDMQEILAKVNNKKVAFFQTQGAELGSEHSVTAFARAATYLGGNCYILGTFASQGKINPALLARRRNSDPKDPHSATERNIKRWEKAAGHPNEEDRQRAQEFVEKLQHKLELRERYLARQNKK